MAPQQPIAQPGVPQAGPPQPGLPQATGGWQPPGINNAQRSGGTKPGVIIGIVAGVIGLLAIVVVALLVMTSGGKSNTAQGTADEFMTAFVDHDCNGMWELMTDSYQDEFSSKDRFCDRRDKYATTDARWEWNERRSAVDQDNPVYRYEVEAKFSGDWEYDIWYEVTVTEDDGTWRVSLLY